RERRLVANVIPQALAPEATSIRDVGDRDTLQRGRHARTCNGVTTDLGVVMRPAELPVRAADAVASRPVWRPVVDGRDATGRLVHQAAVLVMRRPQGEEAGFAQSSGGPRMTARAAHSV